MWHKYRNKVTKLLMIVKAIKNNEDLKREDLARLCGGVSKQTVSNYINILRKIGYPIAYNYSKNGYELYRHDYTNLENGFTPDELLLLLLALDSLKNFSRRDVNNLKNKLLNFLPEDNRDEIQKVIREMNTYSTKKDENEFIFLAKVYEAIIDEKVLSIFYKSATSDKAERESVLPYAVVWKRDKCYLIAKNSNYEWPINYRLDRVEDVKITNEQKEIPDSFNLEKYVAQTWRMFSGPLVEVVLKFSKEIKSLVKDNFHVDYRSIENEDEEDFLLTANVRGLKGLKIWLLSLGENAEVLKPKYFRKEIMETVQSIERKYKN